MPPAQGEGSPRAQIPRNVFWLGIVSLLNDFSSEMIFPLLPLFFTTVLGASPALLGAMEGLVESTASLLKLGSGWLADRLERRKPLIVSGYLLASLSRPLLALAGAPWHVVGLRVVDRVGKGIRGAPRDALIADSTEPEVRGAAFGFHRAMDHLGAIAGPVTALVLIPLVFRRSDLRPSDYRTLFAIAAVPALLSVLVLLACVREAPRRAVAAAPQPGHRPLPASFWWLVGLVALFELGNSSDAFLLLRARQTGITPAQLYLIWALLHLVKSVLSTPAGRLSDRIPRKWLIVTGWLVFAAVYLGFGGATHAWQIWGLFAVYGIYFALVEGTERALVADLVSGTSRGVAYGWFNAALGLAALPASALFGLLWSWRGPGAAFGFGAALALTAALLLVPLRVGTTGRQPG